jgi:hypothetical protein
MTPQEKAKELFMRNFEITVDDYCAKQCALIAVDEIILEMDNVMLPNKHYWNEVKHEIEKL